MKNKKILKIFTLYDLIAIMVIFILLTSLYGIFVLNNINSASDTLVVEQNGNTVLTLTQQQLNKDGIYNFKFDNGTGQIEVKDKKVRMLPMDKKICPRSICSETGWIDRNPKSIVCLPNRLMASFEGSKQINEVDGVSF